MHAHESLHPELTFVGFKGLNVRHKVRFSRGACMIKLGVVLFLLLTWLDVKPLKEAGPGTKIRGKLEQN